MRDKTRAGQLHHVTNLNMHTFDAIILGSGHNSLILQAYLARAGLDTICLEQRDTAGGGLSTVERPVGSGFWHNTHSFFHRGVTQLPWYRDLELARHGARYVQPPLNAALICSDGRVLQWWDDFEKTCASFTEFSTKDANTLRHWRDRFRPIVTQILEPEAQAPPLPPEQRRELLSQTENGRLLLQVSSLSPLEFVRREFEHPAIQAALLFFNGLREVDLRCPGFGHHIPALFAADRMAQMCVGGSRRLAEALIDAVQEAGGTILVNSTPRRIHVENGRATAVETSDGQRFHARQLIASGLNPQQTFLELIEPTHLPDQWKQRAHEYRYNLLAPLFSLNVSLREPPRYEAAASCPELDQALMVIVGIDDAARFDQIVAQHEAGSIPPTVMWGSCPTQFDVSQAPDERHTAFMWEKLPFRLGGNALNWEAALDQHAHVMMDVWNRYAPNLSESVIDWFAASPLDVQRTFANMRDGDLLVGSFAHGQLGYHRPFPGAGHYRGHLPGLYLCGSCCHPGGNITGLPGYNAAQVISADLGLDAPWAPPPIAKAIGNSDR